MTTIYVDTEFNGFGGELMSMGLVTDDGREWYEVLPLPTNIEPWVAEHVVPILGKEPISADAFRTSLHSFLRTIHDPVVVADWYADFVHFFACLSGRNHFESLPFFCKARLVDLDGYDSAIPHNALADARAIKAAIEGPRL